MCVRVVQCLCGSHKTTVGLGFLPLLVISVTELSKEVPYLLSPVFGVLFYLFVFCAGNWDQALSELGKTAELHRICIWYVCRTGAPDRETEYRSSRATRFKSPFCYRNTLQMGSINAVLERVHQNCICSSIVSVNHLEAIQNFTGKETVFQATEWVKAATDKTLKPFRKIQRDSQLRHSYWKTSEQFLRTQKHLQLRATKKQS